MVKRSKRVLILASLLAAVAVTGGAVAFHGEAQAEDVQAFCLSRPEALFILDRDGDRCAYIDRDLPDWSVIGMRSVADHLHNQATAHDVLVSNGSTRVLIRRGFQVATLNFGTSNQWIPPRP